MKFVAKFSTGDGRLTGGKTYMGQILWLHEARLEWIPDELNEVRHSYLRICVFDNKGEWMTFSPSAFLPSDLLTSAMRPVSPE